MALHRRAELWEFRNSWYGYPFLDSVRGDGHGLTPRQKQSTSSTSTSDTVPSFYSRRNRRKSTTVITMIKLKARHKATTALIFLVQAGKGRHRFQVCVRGRGARGVWDDLGHDLGRRA